MSWIVSRPWKIRFLAFKRLFVQILTLAQRSQASAPGVQKKPHRCQTYTFDSIAVIRWSLEA